MDLSVQRLLAQRPQGFKVQLQQPIGVAEQPLTRSGQAHPLIAALQQPFAQLLFQPLDLHADRPLGAKQPRRHALETAYLYHGDDSAAVQLAKRRGGNGDRRLQPGQVPGRTGAAGVHGQGIYRQAGTAATCRLTARVSAAAAWAAEILITGALNLIKLTPSTDNALFP